ncbi:hypothetical protein Dda_1536 [Drechslerella dactyloides]|uniref:Uncharacterized protein n=1 Tax=Drechslerella dactyloides TaxID=74499 RepID=A0AAD6J1W8_DREDA|nr:hypothetical protein Dda_1536 [Drechslerella dactyloides]
MFLGSQYKALQASRDRLSEQLDRVTDKARRLHLENTELDKQCELWEQFVVNREMELASLLDELNEITNEIPDSETSLRLAGVKAAVVALMAKVEALAISLGGTQAQAEREVGDEVDSFAGQAEVSKDGAVTGENEAGSDIESEVQGGALEQAALEVDVDGALQADFTAK